MKSGGFPAAPAGPLVPMKNEPPPPDDPSPGLVLYTTPDGTARLHLRIERKTLWLTQAQMASIFQTTKQNISLHIQNVYSEHELPPEATVKQYLTVQNEGSRRVERLLDHYSLDVVIAVGYRVRSTRGTQFRQWATATLREYLTKGFAIDDERLVAGGGLGADYFNEMAALNRAVTMYLDYAEDQAVRQRPMHMADWVQKLDGRRVISTRPSSGSSGWSNSRPQQSDRRQSGRKKRSERGPVAAGEAMSPDAKLKAPTTLPHKINLRA